MQDFQRERYREVESATEVMDEVSGCRHLDLHISPHPRFRYLEKMKTSLDGPYHMNDCRIDLVDLDPMLQN
jgi:hypothetical protein